MRSALSAQSSGMRTSRTWTNTVESEKGRKTRRSWWKRGTHLSLQVAQQHTRCMTLSTIIARPMHHAKRTQWCGPGPGVHECLPCIVLSEIVLDNVENQESQCEGPGAACKSISKFAPLWGGARGPGGTTEVKPRDHTRVSVRVDRPRREGWAPLGN